jgi:hypothetical protein
MGGTKNLKQRGKFWHQVRAMIWEKTEELFMQEQARTMDFFNRPEKCELREGGYYHEAKLIVLRELWREKKGLCTNDEEPFQGQA